MYPGKSLPNIGGSDGLHIILDVVQHRPPKGVNEMQLLSLAAQDPGEFKHVRVNLWGVDGNAFIVMGVVKKALQAAGCSHLKVSFFLSQCMAGDYENLLAVCNDWVSLVHFEPEEPKGSAWQAFRDACLKEH